MVSSTGVTTDQYFNTGALVEISSNEEEFRGSLCLGTIIRPPGNAEIRTGKVWVEYKTITEELNLVDIRPPPPCEVRTSYNISDFVDAYYRERWWEGLITGVKGSGKYSVFFKGTKELIDFKAYELRLHREWVYGKWVPSLEHVRSVISSEIPLSSRGVKSKRRKIEHEFGIGANIEVRSDEEGYQGAWFAATVLERLSERKYLVEYQNFRNNDEDDAKLTEKVYSPYIRPCPPDVECVDSFTAPQEVDALYVDAWWVGKVDKVLEDAKYCVYFNITGKKLIFKHSDLRVHQEWIDGKWVVSSKIPLGELEAVDTLVSDRRYAQCKVQKAPQWRTRLSPPTKLSNSGGVRFKSGLLLPEYEPEKSKLLCMIPLSTSGVKPKRQKIEHEFSIGANVEVTSNEKGYKGAWYAATVLKNLEGKYLVEYQNIRNDYGDAKLTEKVKNKYIRPCPPDLECVDSFTAHQKIDAFYVDAWWVGEIDDVLEDDKYCVCFKSTGKKLIFKHSELRVHHDLVDGKWVVASKTPQRTVEGVGGLVSNGRCTQCKVQKTLQWRTGPLGPNTLCNACGFLFKHGRLVPEYRQEKTKPLHMEPNGRSVSSQRCTHCQIQEVQLTQAGPLGPKTLCNGCGFLFKSGQLLPEHRLEKSKPLHMISQETKGGSVSGKRCTHCQVQKTPLWRTGPLGRSTLCNACGIRFKRGLLFPEYRPACSPTFSPELHSNSHRNVLEMRLQHSGRAQFDPAIRIL